MIAPIGAPSVAEAVRAGAEVYAALRARPSAAGHATGLGDEGGFAPEIAEPDAVLAELVAAIGDAGYTAAADRRSSRSPRNSRWGGKRWSRVGGRRRRRSSAHSGWMMSQ
jgi:hypothetical protein